MSRGLGEMCQISSDVHLPWPDCESHYELTTGNADFYSWVWNSMSTPHAPVHLWLGGVLDCDTMYNKIGDLVGPDVAEALAFLANGHRKGLFIANVWGCAGTAAVDEKPDEVRRNAVLKYINTYVRIYI